MSGTESEDAGADEGGDNNWDDWEEDEEDMVLTKCLLCPNEFPSADAALAHCTGKGGALSLLLTLACVSPSPSAFWRDLGRPSLANVPPYTYMHPHPPW